MELPPDELTLGSLGVLAQLDEAEGEAAGPNAELLGARRVELLVLPALVVRQDGGVVAPLLTCREAPFRDGRAVPRMGSMLVVGVVARAQLRRRRGATVALVLLMGMAGGVVLAAVAGASRTDTAMNRF